MTMGDLYSLLGVPATASPEEIRAAYRIAARRFHPDANPNPGAGDEFKLIAEAYAVLSDPAQRPAYDQKRIQKRQEPLLAVRLLFSREVLPQLAEPQILYALVDIQPGLLTDLPDPPVNLCLVIDRSTSMQGTRLDQVKAAVLRVIDGLHENDTFSVVAFSDKAEVIVPAQRGLSERTLAKAKVSTINANGGTEILPGLLCGLTELHRHLNPAVVNHLLLLTDGRTYGDEEDCLMLAGLVATDGISISGLGIGDEWNDKFLDELTGRTGGTAAYISSPQQVKAFIQDQMRGLEAIYAQRLRAQVILDPEVKLLSAFKVSPEAGPVPMAEQPLRLGHLPKEQSVSFLIKFILPPVMEGAQSVARLIFQADAPSLGREGERTLVDIALPIAKQPTRAMPPAAVVEALGKLSQYELQERAWQEAAAGNVAAASRHLQVLSTRLLASGQTGLAKVALSEARRLENTQILSEEAKKHLKYGTRALMPVPAGAGQKPR